MSLAGKYALITGSSRGIGRGIALKLAERGVRVCIHYFQNESAATNTMEEVRQRGSDGFILQADVTQMDQVTEIFNKVKSEFGKLDIFVANARPEAPAFFHPPMDITLEQLDAAFDSQVKSFLLSARQAAALMNDGGRLLAITYHRECNQSRMDRRQCFEFTACASAGPDPELAYTRMDADEAAWDS